MLSFLISEGSDMSSWFYILCLKSGKLYPGATTNIDQRWKDHVSGTACCTTKYDPPVQLVYSEEFQTFSEARTRESQIKRWSAGKKEALVTGDLQNLSHLASSREP